MLSYLWFVLLQRYSTEFIHGGWSDLWTWAILRNQQLCNSSTIFRNRAKCYVPWKICRDVLSYCLCIRSSSHWDTLFVHTSRGVCDHYISNDRFLPLGLQSLLGSLLHVHLSSHLQLSCDVSHLHHTKLYGCLDSSVPLLC